jgi:hypothetical protein
MQEAFAELESARRAERAAQVLSSREYAFCLYPREALRGLLHSL